MNVTKSGDGGLGRPLTGLEKFYRYIDKAELGSESDVEEATKSRNDKTSFGMRCDRPRNENYLANVYSDDQIESHFDNSSDQLACENSHFRDQLACENWYLRNQFVSQQLDPIPDAFSDENYFHNSVSTSNHGIRNDYIHDDSIDSRFFGAENDSAFSRSSQNGNHSKESARDDDFSKTNAYDEEFPQENPTFSHDNTYENQTFSRDNTYGNHSFPRDNSYGNPTFSRYNSYGNYHGYPGFSGKDNNYPPQNFHKYYRSLFLNENGFCYDEYGNPIPASEVYVPPENFCEKVGESWPNDCYESQRAKIRQDILPHQLYARRTGSLDYPKYVLAVSKRPLRRFPYNVRYCGKNDNRQIQNQNINNLTYNLNARLDLQNTEPFEKLERCALLPSQLDRSLKTDQSEIDSQIDERSKLGIKMVPQICERSKLGMEVGSELAVKIGSQIGEGLEPGSKICSQIDERSDSVMKSVSQIVGVSNLESLFDEESETGMKIGSQIDVNKNGSQIFGGSNFESPIGDGSELGMKIGFKIYERSKSVMKSGSQIVEGSNFGLRIGEESESGMKIGSQIIGGLNCGTRIGEESSLEIGSQIDKRTKSDMKSVSQIVGGSNCGSKNVKGSKEEFRNSEKAAKALAEDDADYLANLHWPALPPLNKLK